jgi:uncharacterized protein YfeS
MGQLKPAHVEVLFVSFGNKKITGEVQHKIKNDLLVALRFARLKLPKLERLLRLRLVQNSDRRVKELSGRGLLRSRLHLEDVCE